MRGLTFRTTAAKELALQEKARERCMGPAASLRHHPLAEPHRQQKRKAPRVHLNSHNPLCCFYYAKSVRGRWSNAERVCTGMRWNWYMSHNKRTPLFAPHEHADMPLAVSGRMKSMKGKREEPMPHDQGRACETGTRHHHDHFSNAEVRIVKNENAGPIAAGAETGIEKENVRRDAAGAAGDFSSARASAGELIVFSQTIQSECARTEVMVKETRGSGRKAGTTSAPLASGRADAPAIAQPAPQDPPRLQALATVPSLSGALPEAPATQAPITSARTDLAFYPITLSQDTARYDEEAPRNPMPPALQAAALQRTPKIGYVGSYRRKTLQLKQTQGAADLPE